MTDYLSIEDAAITAISEANAVQNLGLVKVDSLSAATVDYENLDGAQISTPGAYVGVISSRAGDGAGTRGTVAERVGLVVTIITYNLTGLASARREFFDYLSPIVVAVLGIASAVFKTEYQGYDFVMYRSGACVHEIRFSTKTITKF